MADLVQLTIDPKTVESIVSAQIRTAIAAQFGKAPEMIEAIAARAISQKVDENGKVSDREYYNSTPLIEFLCAKAIKETAEAAMREWVAEQRPKIVAAIKKHMDAHKNDMVKAFVKAAEEAISPKFDISCNLTPRDPRHC